MDTRFVKRVFLILSVLITHEASAVEIIAHRGYSCGKLENTIESVEDAWLAGADGVELDLRVSRDKVIFLYHDNSIDGRPITRSDYAEIVARKQSSAPKLVDILGLGDPPGYFILDLKEPDPAKYRSLPLLISESGIDERRIAFQSSRIEVLTFLKGQLPEARFFYLSHLKRRFPLYRTPKPESILAVVDGYGVDGVSLKGRQFLDESFVREIKDAGYRVNIWTINDPVRATYYRELGVDGLITDFVEDVRAEAIDEVQSARQCSSS